MQHEGEDIPKKFLECLEEDLKDVYKILKTEIPINMTEADEKNFKETKVC